MVITSRVLVRSFLAAALAGLIVVGAVVPSQAEAAPGRGALYEHRLQVASLFDAHNAERTSRGLGALVLSHEISMQLSQPFTDGLAKSGSIQIHHNTFAEMSKFGRSPGENVVSGTTRANSAEVFHRAWMDSPGHKANILRDHYTIVSFGFATSADGRYQYSTANFFASSDVAGHTFATGAAWLKFLEDGPTASPTPPPPTPTPTPSPEPTVNVYLDAGDHVINGRRWRTRCEPYSQTRRCQTDIWATQTEFVNGSWVSSNGWVFNNLTYAPSLRSLWGGNPLGAYGKVGGKASWTAGGRTWRTECDSALTGRGGCRSFLVATVVEAHTDSAGVVQYRQTAKEIFNSMVLFS